MDWTTKSTEPLVCLAYIPELLIVPLGWDGAVPVNVTNNSNDLQIPERLSPSQGTYPGWPSASERIRRLIKFAALAEPTMPKSCMASDMEVLNPGNAAESCIKHPHCPGTPNHFTTSGQSLDSPEISVGKWEAAPVRTLPGELQIKPTKFIYGMSTSVKHHLASSSSEPRRIWRISSSYLSQLNSLPHFPSRSHPLTSLLCNANTTSSHLEPLSCSTKERWKSWWGFGVGSWVLHIMRRSRQTNGNN